MNAAARLHEVLQAPTVAQLVEPLPAIAAVLEERLDYLAHEPSLPDVDALLRDLSGLTAHLMRLRLALVREAQDHAPEAHGHEQ